MHMNSIARTKPIEYQHHITYYDLDVAITMITFVVVLRSDTQYKSNVEFVCRKVFGRPNEQPNE